MALAESLISFGSYDLPLGARVKARQADTDIEETKMLGGDGTIAPPGVLAAQIIEVEIEIGGGGDFDPASTLSSIIYLDTMDKLNNAMNDCFAQLEVGYQALTIGYTPARTIQAQKRKFSPAYLEGSGRRHATIGMEFYAPDPRWLSVSSQTITASGSATNNGNATTYPVVTYQQSGGPASGQPVLKIDTRSGYVQLTLNITLASGDELVIDCDPRHRSYGGIIYTPSLGSPKLRFDLLGTTGILNTIGNDSTFPYLLPGTHTVTMSGANSISCVWNDAYLL